MADEKAFDVSTRYEDPSAKIWSVYITQAEKYDHAISQNWKQDMNSILIFAGLFSAIVTTFLIESYRTLKPDPTDISVSLLVQISQQLAAMSTNGTPASDIPMVLPVETPFVPSTSALICNTLWFMSLGFSLVCALSATLVEQWTRNYLQATENRSTPHQRARICSYLYQGLNKFGMPAVVETIPLLLHISLLLFFSGLAEFLRDVNVAMRYLILAVLTLCGSLYLLITVLPVFYYDCPYRTPLSPLTWRILRMFRLLRYENELGGTTIITGTMVETREMAATEVSPRRDDRDLDAMCWTIQAMQADTELEPFVEVIPSVVAGFDYSGKLLLHKLLHHADVAIRLRHRVPKLLSTCLNGRLQGKPANARAVTCLSAIWSLTMMAVPVVGASPYLSRETLRFDERTMKCIRDVKFDVPDVADHAVSALVVIARHIIDMYLDQAQQLEDELLQFFETGKLSSHRVHGQGNRNSSFLTRRVQRQIYVLEEQLLSVQGLTSPLPYVTMETLHAYLDELVDVAVSARDGRSTEDWVRDTLESLHAFRRNLNQAGFSLTLEYISHILSNATLPYEAFSTLRRLFFKIQWGHSSSSNKLSRSSQTRLVTYLDEALEPDGSRLPESIVNVLLGLVRALDDPACVVKAKGIVERYTKVLASRMDDSAEKALSILSVSTSSSEEGETAEDGPLDIFRSHMYANTRLDRSFVSKEGEVFGEEGGDGRRRREAPVNIM